jgi:hypothetical protein
MIIFASGLVLIGDSHKGMVLIIVHKGSFYYLLISNDPTFGSISHQYRWIVSYIVGV